MSQLTSIEKEEKIIYYVSQNSILYDLKHKEYKNKLKKKDIWDEIGRKMDLAGDEVESIWKKLKDQYTKYIRKCKSKTANGSKHISYRHSKSMEFYSSCYIPYKSIISIEESEGKQSDEEQFIDEDHFFQEDELFVESANATTDNIGFYENSNTSNVSNATKGSSGIGSNSTINQPERTRNRKRKSNVDEAILGLISERKNLEPTEGYFFGQVVASKIDRLLQKSRRQGAQAQVEIQQVLLKYESD